MLYLLQGTAEGSAALLRVELTVVHIARYSTYMHAHQHAKETCFQTSYAYMYQVHLAVLTRP